MTPLEWTGLLLGLALSSDLAWARFRGWRTKQQAIKCGRTLTAKYALSPRGPWGRSATGKGASPAIATRRKEAPRGSDV